MEIDVAQPPVRGLAGLRLLSICTSTAKASIFATTIDQDGQLADGALVFQEVGRESASMIFRLIDDALSRADLSDFDIVCFDTGPGAFTGVRIGCGVSQGLGFGKSIPVVGVNSLAAQAFPKKTVLFGRPGQPHGRLSGVAIDARMGEVYCGVYRNFQGLVTNQTTVLAPTVCSAEQAAVLFDKAFHQFPDDEIILGGNALGEAGQHLALVSWARTPGTSNITVVPFLTLDARMIANLALFIVAEQRLEFKNKEDYLQSLKSCFSASHAAPEYVRNSVALDKIQQAQLRLERSR